MDLHGLNLYDVMFSITYGLRSDEHWAVFISLLGGEVISLTELRAHFDSTYHELLPLLEDLLAGDLVEQFIIYDSDFGNLDRRFYRVSIRGICFYARLMDSCLPRLKK